MSRAWFGLAVAGVLGLFYVGAGLQSGPQAGSVAQGQEVKVKPLFEQRPERTKGGPPVASLEWERLGRKLTGREIELRGGFTRAYRTKIPGGWLVEASTAGDSAGVGLAFVPDPEHHWDGNSLP